MPHGGAVEGRVGALSKPAIVKRGRATARPAIAAARERFSVVRLLWCDCYLTWMPPALRIAGIGWRSCLFAPVVRPVRDAQMRGALANSIPVMAPVLGMLGCAGSPCLAFASTVATAPIPA